MAEDKKIKIELFLTEYEIEKIKEIVIMLENALPESVRSDRMKKATREELINKIVPDWIKGLIRGAFVDSKDKIERISKLTNKLKNFLDHDLSFDDLFDEDAKEMMRKDAKKTEKEKEKEKKLKN